MKGALKPIQWEKKLCSKPSKPKKLSREDLVRLEEQRDRVEVQKMKLQTIERWLKENNGGPGLRYAFSATHLQEMTTEQACNKIDTFYREACLELMNAVPKYEVASE